MSQLVCSFCTVSTNRVPVGRGFAAKAASPLVSICSDYPADFFDAGYLVNIFIRNYIKTRNGIIGYYVVC